MNDEKAARLAAIRAANARKQPSAPTAGLAPTEGETIALDRGRSNAGGSAPLPRAATRTTMLSLDDMPPAITLHGALLMLLAVGAGVFAAVVALPAWLPGLSASLLGPEPKAYWYLSRASALVAFALLWLSMALGLSMTNRLARAWPGGPTAFDLHQHASLLGLAFALFHALILLGDTYSNYTLAQLLVPFGSASYRPLWVGLGQIGLYAMAIVAFSFYARGLIGRAGWRLIHFLSFAMYALALLHGLQSGTDSAAAWAQTLYWGSAASVLFLVVYRVLAKVVKPAARRQRAS